MTMSSDMRFPPGMRGHGGRSADEDTMASSHGRERSNACPTRTAVHPGGGNDLITRPGGHPSHDADEVLGGLARMRSRGRERCGVGCRAEGDEVSPEYGSASTLTGSDQ